MPSQTVSIEGVLSEDIDNTLAVVFNMLRTISAPGAAVAGFTTLTLTDNVIEYAVALIMATAGNFPRWLYVPSTTCLGNVDTTLRRAQDKRMYNAVFTSDCQTSAITVQSVFAKATS